MDVAAVVGPAVDEVAVLSEKLQAVRDRAAPLGADALPVQLAADRILDDIVGLRRALERGINDIARRRLTTAIAGEVSRLACTLDELERKQLALPSAVVLTGVEAC